MSGVVEHLREHDPSTLDELPYSPSIGDKQKGVARLRFSKCAYAHQENKYGNLKAVYYLVDEHDEEEVVKAYLEANPQVSEAEGRDIVRLMGRMGSSWRDAAREVVA